MTAPSFSYSGNVYTSAAVGSVDFALTSTTGNAIAYLQKAHIHVYKSTNQGATWTELTRPSQWDFTSGGTVARLVTGIASGDWIKVQRITPSTAAYVTFQSSSLLTADQLNDDTLFNTYLNQERYDQGDQSSTVAVAASAAAASATSAATAATTTANAASTAAAAATTTANAASASAATALSQSNTAITDSAAALAASANAVTTANTAASNAASAVTTAGTASTNATAAVNTANTAASNASTALSQSTTALTNSATALSTANTAASNASTALTNSSTAVTTANTASTNASNAVTTANTANTNATAALNAVASSLQYVLVANVAAIPSSPANNYAIEVADSTGVESFSPLANRPAGFVGDAGLSVRMQYSTTGPTWNWLNYFPNNAETRYLKVSGGTLTGQLRADDSTLVAAPVIAFDGDINTGIAHTGADELALVTGGTARLTIDASGNVAVPGGLTKGGNSVVTTGDTGSVTSAMIADGTIVNADINASAGIAGTKISPDFGAQNVTTTGTVTGASLSPTSSTVPANGVYLPAANTVGISTNSSERIRIGANGEIGIGGANYGTSGQVLTSGGSGAAPSWQTLSVSANSITQGNTSATVTDTGSDGRFVVTTEGTERLRVDSSGRLGLGTSTVDSRFVVRAQSGVSDTPIVKIEHPSNDADFAISGLYDSDGNVTYLGSNLYYNSSYAPARFDTGKPSSAITLSGRTGNGEITFLTGTATASERARIDSSGRLLVGTSSARDKFNNSASGQDPLVQFEAAGTAAKELYMLSLTANNNSTSSNAGVSLMLARSNGTTLNSYDLVPSGNCIGQIRFQAADGSELVEAANISAFVDGTSGANDMPGRLVFSTTADGASSPTERMRISNNGTIFLNATSLTDGANIQGANAYVGWRFDVGSNSDTLADQNTALCSSVYTSTNTGRATSALLLMSRAGASVGVCPLIKGYGGAGSEPSTATLQFLVSHNGNVQNTNNSYGSLSDLRLKENIVDAESQWQDIKSLQVRKFNFKNDAAKTPLLGLVAQEVEPISPGLIEQVLQADGTPDPEIPKAIKYSVLYMKAVKALQEAMERIETLEAKVAALESV